VTLWDSNTLTQVSSVKAHKSLISCAIYVPNRKKLITSSLDKTIVVFDVSDKQISTQNSFTLTGSKSFIYGLCYLDDIDRLVSAGYEPEIKFWNLDTKQIDFTISTNGWASDSYEIAHIKDEKLIALVGKDMIKLFDYTTKSFFHEIKTDGLSMNSIQYLKKHNAFVTAIKPGVIRMWSVDGRQIKEEKDIKFEAVGETPYTLYAIEEQDLIIVSTRSKFVGFVKISDGSFVKKSTGLRDGIAITVLRNAAKMIVADNQSNKLQVFSIN